MKRYLVFMVQKAYDPQRRAGGWYDYHGDFDSFEEARDAARIHCERNPHLNYQVIDTNTQKIIEHACEPDRQP